MSDAAVKETRRILRQVHAHLTQFRLNQGVLLEQTGLVDVLHHPKNCLPDLNYITPRKNTAWIFAKDIQAGFDVLRQHNRALRIEYVEGLFPERFAESLEEVGLGMERARPLLVYQVDQTPFKVPSALDGVQVDIVNDAQGSALWWYVWRNTYYQVVSHMIDPVFIGQDLWKIHNGTQIDLVMYRYRFPVGIARLTIDRESQSAQIIALTMLKEFRNEASVRLLQAHAMQAAIRQGCILIFTSGASEDDAKIYRDHRFIDCSSVLCYAELHETKCEEAVTNGSVEQSVLTHP